MDPPSPQAAGLHPRILRLHLANGAILTERERLGAGNPRLPSPTRCSLLMRSSKGALDGHLLTKEAQETAPLGQSPSALLGSRRSRLTWRAWFLKPPDWGHISKNSEEYAEWWVPDDTSVLSSQGLPFESSVWGGNAAPASFEEYKKLTANRRVWADGLMLQALAARLGTCLVVWAWAASQKSWQRYVLAPFLRDGALRLPDQLC